jgi:hypothetical protein
MKAIGEKFFNMKFLRLALLIFLSIVFISEGCASKKRRNNKPCDCPEFDNQPRKRKKRSDLPKENIWYWNDSFEKQNVA